MGSGRRLECLWVLWASVGRAWRHFQQSKLFYVCCLLPVVLLMTSAEDRNDRLTTQKKLEWVTPQISLMGAVEVTEGKGAITMGEVGMPISQLGS